jgi:hypothetical protein
VDLNSPEDMDRLLDHIYYKRPALVVIDSLYTIFPRCRLVSKKNFHELTTILSSAAADTQTAILLVTEAFMYVRRKRFRYYDILLSDILPDNWLAGLECTVLGLHYLKTGQILDPEGLHRLKILKSIDCQRVDPVCFEFIPLANDGVSLEWKPVPATLRGGRN